MNLGLISAAMSMSSEEKSLVETVKSWVAPFVGGIAASSMSVPQLVGMLKGEAAPPSWLQGPLSALNSYLGRVDDKAIVNLITLVSKNSLPTVLQLSQRFASHLDLPEPVVDQDSLVRNVRVLIERSVALSGMYQPTAICICPKCKFTFLSLKEE